MEAIVTTTEEAINNMPKLIKTVILKDVKGDNVRVLV